MRFLSVDDVLAIHENTIRHEGGSPGLREAGLLESAVLMPQESFGGEYLHSGLAEMAAAYLFHLSRNHPFLDGNQRVSALAALIFLGSTAPRSCPSRKTWNGSPSPWPVGRWGSERSPTG